MKEEDARKLIEQLRNELNGDAEHDIDVLMDWGDRYRKDPEAELLNREIISRIMEFIREEDDGTAEEIFRDILADAQDIYDEACEKIRLQQYPDAVSRLYSLMDMIRDFPLPQDTVWKDFNSLLDSLLYQDFYSEEINGREIGRHPMHPGKILFTFGSLLIEINEPEKALEPLELLLTFDPACPKYLFETGEAYKRTGQIGKAIQIAMRALSCASNRAELARSYRDIAYCMSETGEFEDAMILNLLSLQYQPSRQAQNEIIWLRKNMGINPDNYDEVTIRDRCKALNIPIGFSETVLENMEFLEIMRGSTGD